MLGVLVEFEIELGVDSMIVLVECFEGVCFFSCDVIVVLIVGLCGGGW